LNGTYLLTDEDSRGRLLSAWIPTRNEKDFRHWDPIAWVEVSVPSS
jgi:hypothetical protein